ncbi:MAG: hypothetical protein Q8Q30_01205 [Candidatus Woesebacteria bacterium]|nr:hypothetical protein [Candidatus Woesebacteria bacterium]
MLEYGNLLLDDETIKRFCREWKNKKGPKNMKALTTKIGDRIYVGTEEPTGNKYIDEQLLYSGDIILTNEMGDDLKKKKKVKK